MRFHGQVTRKTRKKKRKLLPLLIPAILIAIVLFLYFVNARLTPIYVGYAEVQTTKIAAHVINKAITSQSTGIPGANDIFVDVENESTGMVTTKIDAQAVSRVLAETQALVVAHLEQAEAGNLDMLPMQDNIQFDPQAMESQGGVVFFVPIGQAANIPLLGNLGPKIPIRFHVIGNVRATTATEITEFGINNAYVEVNVILTVDVQIIVPLATRNSVVEQKIPVAMGFIRGTVPQIYNNGDGNSPSIEVPIELPKVK